MFTRVPLILSFDDHSGAAADETDDSNEFALPENLGDLSREDLDALETEAVEAFDAVRSGDLDEAAIQALSDLTSAIEAIRGEQTSRDDAAANQAAEAEALAARVHGTEVDGATETEEIPADGDEATTEDAVEAAAEEAEVVTPDAVVAAGARRSIRLPLGAVARHGQRPESVVAETGGRATITAAADIPGVTAGSEVTRLQVAQAMHDRARHLGNKGSAPIATFARETRHVIGARDDFDAMQATIADAVTLPGDGSAQALVAAGGWCAPSETVYDLFSIEGTDGLVDVPTLTVNRGGIEFPLNGGPSIADVFASTGIWLWTEQDDIDALDPETGPTKPCARIPCVTFDEERLDAHGVCLTHGNLADRAYPELTNRYVDLVMSAHAHLINYRRLAAMAAAATDVTIAADLGVAAPILDAVDLQGMDYRDKYRMSDSVVLEIVMPRWVRGIIRADLARRNGVDLLSVSNAEITQWFTERQYRPQFVYDWLSLQTGPSIAQPGTADGFREAWPTEARALIYAAGTFVAGTGGSIDLGVTRDSALNATNDHTAAWTEEFMLLAKRGHEARELIVTGLDPTGETGGFVVAVPAA